MKRTILAILTIAILLAASAGSAPCARESKTVSDAPPQNTEVTKVVRDELQEKAEEQLKNLTLDEKIGQLLIVGFPQGTKEEVIQEYIERFKVSGFILFRRNYKDFNSEYTLVKSLKEKNALKNPLPLFISTDEEGGTVTRLPKGGTLFPDAKQIGSAGNAELTYKSGEVIGHELRAAGINLNFAPVLDIVTSSENKLLIKRSYGSTAEAVSLHGISFINGLQSTGIIASPKHFPGHGSTNVDSHGKLPVINIDKSKLSGRELVPFKAAIDAGLDALMVGHLAFPQLDPSGLPATMSSYFLTDILRKEMGFEGVAISDEIEMYGYLNGKATLDECVVTSFNAGLDIFVIGHTKKFQDRVLKALTEACKDGRITQDRLNESVLRIIKLKLKYKLEDTMKYSLEEAGNEFGSEEHKAVLMELKNAIK